MPSRAQLAAVGLGARPEKEAPAAPQIPAALGGEVIAILMRELAEHIARAHGGSDGIAAEMEKGRELLGRILEVVRAAPTGIQKDEVSEMLAELGSTLSGRIAGIEKRLDNIGGQLTAVANGQALILEALYAPVVPEYDQSGRVIAARRK